MANAATPVEILQLAVRDQLETVGFSDFPLFNRMRKESSFQDVIKWPVNLGGAESSGRLTTANANTATASVVKGASLPIGAYAFGHTFTIQETDLTQAQSAGPAALADLFRFHVESALDVIMSDCAKSVFLGDGTVTHTGIVGLGIAADPTASYANLSAANWAPLVDDNAGVNRPLTAEMLIDLEAEMAKRGARYDAIFTTPQIVADYKILFGDSRGLTINAPTPKADLGFSGVSFSGRPIFQDSNCPAGTMYFLHESGFRFSTYRTPRTNNYQGMEMTVGQLPLMNPLAISYEITTIPQMVVLNRKKDVTVIKDIARA